MRDVWCPVDIIMLSLANIHMERSYNIIPSMRAIHANTWQILSILYHAIKSVYAVKVGYDPSLKMNKKNVLVTNVKKVLLKLIVAKEITVSRV